MTTIEDEEPASKAEFVWLMLQLAMMDREVYREERSKGWNSVAAAKIIDGKSDNPN